MKNLTTHSSPDLPPGMSKFLPEETFASPGNWKSSAEAAKWNKKLSSGLSSSSQDHSSETMRLCGITNIRKSSQSSFLHRVHHISLLITYIAHVPYSVECNFGQIEACTIVNEKMSFVTNVNHSWRRQRGGAKALVPLIRPQSDTRPLSTVQMVGWANFTN